MRHLSQLFKFYPFDITFVLLPYILQKVFRPPRSKKSSRKKLTPHTVRENKKALMTHGPRVEKLSVLALSADAERAAR